MNSNQPIVRLFLSADLVGSSAYKAGLLSETRLARRWPLAIIGFFTDFPLLFDNSVDKRRRPDGFDATAAVWKLLGDEIVFAVKIRDFADLPILCSGFFEALTTYNETLAGKGELRLQGHAWVAQFPFPNVATAFDTPSGRQDYIGPDIDLGFRLGSATRAGRMLVSLDLADLLMRESAQGNLLIHQVGWERLRGVNNGMPYPILWARTPRHDRRMRFPWDSEMCSLTGRFLQEKEKQPNEIVEMAGQLRSALRPFPLFRPYLRIEDAPEEHRLILDTGPVSDMDRPL